LRRACPGPVVDYKTELAAAEDVIAAREKAEADHEAAGREWAASYGSKGQEDLAEPVRTVAAICPRDAQEYS